MKLDKNDTSFEYQYRIKEITKMYDGDTITVIIDLGFSTYEKHILRLARINAPEIRGEERPEGLISRDYLRERLTEAVNNNKNIYIKTYKDRTGKYGRYLADIYIDNFNPENCINDEMVAGNLAEYKEYW